MRFSLPHPSSDDYSVSIFFLFSLAPLSNLNWNSELGTQNMEYFPRHPNRYPNSISVFGNITEYRIAFEKLKHFAARVNTSNHATSILRPHISIYWKRTEMHMPKTPWSTALLPVLFLPVTMSHTFQVAVCVAGYVERWLPDYPIPNLIHTNNDAYFTFFFSLQVPRGPASVTLGLPSNLTKLSSEAAVPVIKEMYSSDNSQVGRIAFHQPYSLQKWQKILSFGGQTRSFDRIVNSIPQQVMVLNSYKLQAHCMQDIQEYERDELSPQFRSFSHVILMREDVFFFHPLKLKSLFNMLQVNIHSTLAPCHLISKNCLTRTGLNDKFQVASKEVGLQVFGSRITFYRFLLENNISVPNPQSFEKLQLEYYAMKSCPVSVDVISLTSARVNKQQAVCLMEQEVQTSKEGCVPDHFLKQLEKMRCGQYRVRRFEKNLFIPESFTSLFVK